MIIEIDGYYHQVLLTCKKCSKIQLRQKYLQAKELTYETRDILDIFCRIHNFDQVPYDNEIEVDFIIDTDADRIYTPSY